MPTNSITPKQMLAQYTDFIEAVKKNKPRACNTLATAIINTPSLSNPSEKTKKALDAIKVDLEKLSPTDKKIKNLVQKVLTQISEDEDEDDDDSSPFLKFKSSCNTFIAEIKDSNLDEDDKLLLCTAFIDEIEDLTSLDKSHLRDLIGIKSKLISLRNSNPDGPLKDQINLVIQGITNLTKTLRKKTTSSARVSDSSGISNQGNDCFLIALYQLLKINGLTKHLVNRLPKELWEPLVADNPNAKFIRKTIVEHTNFGPDMTALGENPMESQLDASEVLMSLFNRIDKPDSPPKPKVAEENPLRKTYEEEWSKTTSVLYKMHLFLTFWKDTILETLKYYITTIIFKIFGYNNSDTSSEDTYIPKITVKRPTRPKPEDPNPLTMKIKMDITYKVRRNVPNGLKNHDHFGGATHTGLGFEPNLYLPLAMEKDDKGVYEFAHSLKTHFSQKKGDDTAEATKTITTKNGQVKKITYKADMIKTPHLEEVPDYLFLSLKRFDFNSNANGKKINDPIEGIDLEFSLPEQLLETPVEEADRKYSLQGFVTHIGSFAGGHYITYRKEADGWHYFNDSLHKKVTEDEVKKEAKQAYIVFYEKKTN